MKNLFRSFKDLNKDELQEIWQNAVFIFDTNVLHAVYRYQSSTCEEVLKLMERIQDRIWIPYHVALEFHRNRLSVIGGQHKKFEETRKAIDNAVTTLSDDLHKLQLKKRHSHINPDQLLEGINKLKDDYLKELDTQEAECLKVNSEDHLLVRIEGILTGRVGDKPIDVDVREIMKDGIERYKKFTPPGYKDAIKQTEPDNEYLYDGVKYERQFGDLIVWKQIIEYAKNERVNHLIFVTDDNKEDWWSKSQGKTVGFRTELIDEILSEASLKQFKAYSLFGFLEQAKMYLKESVSDTAIEEVKLTSKSEFYDLLGAANTKKLDLELMNYLSSDTMRKSIEQTQALYGPSEDIRRLIEQTQALYQPSEEIRRLREQTLALYQPSEEIRKLRELTQASFYSPLGGTEEAIDQKQYQQLSNDETTDNSQN